MNTTKKLFKEKIKALAGQSAEARKEIRSSKGMDRWHAWEGKRSIGQSARAVYLAYAYFRGVPYRVLEPKCLEDSGDTTKFYLRQEIFAVLTSMLPVETVISKEGIKEWLAVPGPVAAVVPEMKAEEAAE